MEESVYRPAEMFLHIFNVEVGSVDATYTVSKEALRFLFPVKSCLFTSVKSHVNGCWAVSSWLLAPIHLYPSSIHIRKKYLF